MTLYPSGEGEMLSLFFWMLSRKPLPERTSYLVGDAVSARALLTAG